MFYLQWPLYVIDWQHVPRGKQSFCPDWSAQPGPGCSGLVRGQRVSSERWRTRPWTPGEEENKQHGCKQHEHISVWCKKADTNQEVKETVDTLPQLLQRECFLHRGVWPVWSSGCRRWALASELKPSRRWWRSPAERWLLSARLLRDGVRNFS